MRLKHCVALLVIGLVSPAAIAGAPKPDLYILSVGVDSSCGKGAHDWYAGDAVHVRQALARAESLYGTVHSRLLLAGQATRAEVLNALTWLGDKVGPDDVALLFFSTHGNIDKQKGFSISLATRPDEKEAVLWGAELHAALARVRGKAMVMIDACHTGGLLHSDLRHKHSGSFLLACKTHEQSYGQTDRRDRPHGYYVLALCEALSGRADKNKDGVVTLAELEDYLPGRARAFYPQQHAVVARQGKHAAIPLARLSPGHTAEELWSVTKTRNPFGEMDVPDPDGKDVQDFAARIVVVGGLDDLNAKLWPVMPVKGSRNLIEGEWASRWRGGTQKDQWLPGTAQLRSVGERVYMLFSDGKADYLIDLRRVDRDGLVGRYVSIDQPSDTSPWVGRIIDAERIDGHWSQGRWDLRRQMR